MDPNQARDTLDTNLIVHFILGEPEDQSQKVWELLSDENHIHYIPDLAITEAEYVLLTHYNKKRKDIVFLLQNFLERFNSVLDYNRGLFDLVFPYYESHPSLSFNDCYMAFAAETNHAEPLFTFDTKLAKQHPSAKKLA